MAVKRFGYQHKMFKKFGGGIFKSNIMFGNFQRHVHHVQCIHAHPAGAIRLLQLHFARGVVAAVKHADIIQAQKSPFKNIVAVTVFPVYPPGKIDEQFLKNPF